MQTRDIYWLQYVHWTMGNTKHARSRYKSKHKQSEKQKNNLQGLHASGAGHSKPKQYPKQSLHASRNKENIPIPQSSHQSFTAKSPVKDTQKRTGLDTPYKKKYESAKRQVHQLKASLSESRQKQEELKTQWSQQKKRAELLETRLGIQLEETREAKREVLRLVAEGKCHGLQYADDRKKLCSSIRALEKQVVQLEASARRASVNSKSCSYRFPKLQGGHGHVYSKEMREIAREMVETGCSRKKVGLLIHRIARTFGIEIGGTMSGRTVGWVILEGGVAVKMQIGYELLQMKAIADSTSHRKQNYEAKHGAWQVPDYQSGNLEVSESSIPYATLDHSSQTSVDSWKEQVKDIVYVFNRLPLSQRLNRKFTIRKFLEVIKGMNGDHANNEKCSADGIKSWKREEVVSELGEKKLQSMVLADLILYLASWNAKKIVDVGGIDEWNRLTPDQQADKDAQLMKDIMRDLGEAEYEKLSDTDKRELSLFIWAGCCMHKDQNSFKGGNAEMMAEWVKLEEKNALEASTRSGVKASALAGGVFNNKNDKKGQGDVHTNHFKSEYGAFHKRFPDTSNTRFGSHGLACAELIKHLDKFIQQIRLVKQSRTYTNIESNLLKALRDKPTLTEMCAMVIYMNTISHPYMCVIHGPGTENVNALDLGPLHTQVQEHIQKILDNPEILFDSDISFKTATLNGQPWEDSDSIESVFKMAPDLPQLQPITLAFFRGSLPTWKRFSSEFAPSGLIDEASADEKQLAWMPSTNNANEGRLGHLCVTLRNKPTLTLHQYNAQAMYSRNDTIDFMMALFEEEDHAYIRHEARRLDENKLEKRWKAAQEEF
ncbi:hypothetical protein K435DRAFT_802981 [Dendrothele bispora CBS 962.96]|uniref:Uncharacterized protein n=1 Tax=Dendrothele bispora (strain CBS 962.96) TaxID=1314807 RepID=A0A4S8LJ49_DENBC|nr:hypothetical protein K435DRAFT_802981 [Dendrothele bispora CBS 962.96]